MLTKYFLKTRDNKRLQNFIKKYFKYVNKKPKKHKLKPRILSKNADNIIKKKAINRQLQNTIICKIIYLYGSCSISQYYCFGKGILLHTPH